MHKVIEANKEWGIKMNLAKAECLSTTNGEVLTVEDIKIPRVEKCQLGCHK